MTPVPRISLIVSTYNRPDALACVLAGCIDQSLPAAEIIVADDGSGAPTREVIEAAAARSPVPVEHVWQPDEGFRLARVRNLGILRASGDYLVFLDGDCVPRHDFVQRHAELAEPGGFVTGSRVLLDASFTEDVVKSGLPLQRRAAADWWRDWRAGRINKPFPLAHLPDFGWRRFRRPDLDRLRGCNMAFWKADLLETGGFDEVFEGWGREDTDIVLRLQNLGRVRKRGALATEVFHLWHRENDRSRLGRNDVLIEERLRTRATRAERGIDGTVA